MSTFANVNVGSVANDHTGDPLRNSFIKINQNFANIAGGNAGAVTSVAGRVGNVVLSVNDVQGAANIYFVTTTVAAGNAYTTTYVDTAIENLGNIDVVYLVNQINAIDQHISILSGNIVDLTANAGTQDARITSLNSTVSALGISIDTVDDQLTGRLDVFDANLGSATRNISAINAYLSPMATQISVLEANAATQASSINTLFSNAASQAASINNINGTITALNNNITSLFANAASQANGLDGLTANLIITNENIDSQSLLINSLRANVTAANVNISTLTMNAAIQASAINAINVYNNLFDANVGAYQIYANANAATQATGINLINANVGAYQTWANANISTLYLGNINTNANLGAYQTWANANAATQATSIANLLALTANTSVQLLSANVGAYQIWANSSISDKASLNGATFTGNIVAAAGTATNNAHTGAIVVHGGGGIAVGGNINIENQLFVGVDAQGPFLNQPITVERSTSSSGPGTQYTQHAIINATGTGSSDYIAYPNNYPGFGNDHGWVDLGIAGSEFDDPHYTITHPNDSYLFGSCPSYTGNGGNLVIATDNTGTYNDIIFAANGFQDSNEIARFHANGDTKLTVLGNIVVGNVITTKVSAATLTVTSAIQFANLTTAQIVTISTPTPGSTVYNYDTGNIQVYNGTKWANITLS
jgi:hypothetical protein